MDRHHLPILCSYTSRKWCIWRFKCLFQTFCILVDFLFGILDLFTDALNRWGIASNGRWLVNIELECEKEGSWPILITILESVWRVESYESGKIILKSTIYVIGPMYVIQTIKLVEWPELWLSYHSCSIQTIIWPIYAISTSFLEHPFRAELLIGH
jgi:hypothetical protein